MKRISIASAILGIGSLVFSSTLTADNEGNGKGKGNTHIHHVLLLSIDGMHAVDLDNYIGNHPHSNLAQLSAAGVTFTNASATKPSDSFPAMLGIVTGGTPAVTGVYYDDAYSRSLSPAGSHCATIGAAIDLKETIDADPANVNTTIDPAKLALDPAKGCTPVYPHHLLRVNTIFEVIKAAGLHTAYSEKRPSYEILNGPSGAGVNDLYTPEIAANGTTKSVPKTEAFDDLRVQSILHEINGLDHTGTVKAPVPAIFGMNFQAVNIGEKIPGGGFTDSAGTPSALLQDALDHTDQSIGKIVKELRAQELDSTTLIIVTAKHGNTPADPNQRTLVLNTLLPGLVNGVQASLSAHATQRDIALLWLNDQSKTAHVVQTLTTPANMAAGGIQQVLSGESLKLLFPDPEHDPFPPDIIVIPNMGVLYEPSTNPVTSNLAEHGGFGENDNHVPILFSHVNLAPGAVRSPVQTTQIAPTILSMLNLDPEELQAVQIEHTPVLPGLDLKDHNDKDHDDDR